MHEMLPFHACQAFRSHLEEALQMHLVLYPFILYPPSIMCFNELICCIKSSNVNLFHSSLVMSKCTSLPSGIPPPEITNVLMPRVNKLSCISKPLSRTYAINSSASICSSISTPSQNIVLDPCMDLPNKPMLLL